MPPDFYQILFYAVVICLAASLVEEILLIWLLIKVMKVYLYCNLDGICIMCVISERGWGGEKVKIKRQRERWSVRLKWRERESDTWEKDDLM